MGGTHDSNKIDSSEYVGDRAVIFTGIFLGVQIVAVALRFYARALTPRKYGLDDWLVVASLLSAVASSAVSISEQTEDTYRNNKLTGIDGTMKGLVGYHIGFLEKTNPEAITLFFKYLLFLSTWFYATSGLSRLAICVLYYHLFPQRHALIALNIVIGVLICLPVSTVIAVLAACNPFSAAWAPPEIQATHCLNREDLFLWCTFPNIIVDAVLLTLPIPIIWRLATTVQLKLALTVTFLIGSLYEYHYHPSVAALTFFYRGLVATILRFVAFSKGHSLGDPTFIAVDLIVWTMAEPGIGLISACIIMYRPLLKKIGTCFQNRTAIRTITWPETYTSGLIPGPHTMRRELEEGERDIALGNESSLEQILGGNDGRNHSGRIDVSKNGGPFWNNV